MQILKVQSEYSFLTILSRSNPQTLQGDYWEAEKRMQSTWFRPLASIQECVVEIVTTYVAPI